MHQKTEYSLIEVEVKAGVTAAMHRFKGRDSFMPVFMLHGSMESGRIFYSKKAMALVPGLPKKVLMFSLLTCPGVAKAVRKQVKYSITAKAN